MNSILCVLDTFVCFAPSAKPREMFDASRGRSATFPAEAKQLVSAQRQNELSVRVRFRSASGRSEPCKRTLTLSRTHNISFWKGDREGSFYCLTHIAPRYWNRENRRTAFGGTSPDTTISTDSVLHSGSWRGINCSVSELNREPSMESK